MIEFRLAQSEDIENLKPILTENAIVYDRSVLQQFLREPTAQLFLALDGERVVGYAYAYLQLHPDGKISQHIYNLFVAKSHRRRGIGSQFLEYLLQQAHDIGCHESTTSADPLNGAVRRMMKNFHHTAEDQRTFTFFHRGRR